MTRVRGLGWDGFVHPAYEQRWTETKLAAGARPRLAMSTSSPAWATSRSTCCTLTSAGPRPATTRRRSSNRLRWVSRALSTCARTRDRRPTAGRASAGRSANDAHGDHRFAGQCRQHRSGARPAALLLGLARHSRRRSIKPHREAGYTSAVVLLAPGLPTAPATGDGPDTASGLVGVLDLGEEVALGGA